MPDEQPTYLSLFSGIQPADSTSPSRPSGSDAPDRSSGTTPAEQSSLDIGPTFQGGEMSQGSALLHSPNSDASMRKRRYSQGGANLGWDISALLPTPQSRDFKGVQDRAEAWDDLKKSRHMGGASSLPAAAEFAARTSSVEDSPASASATPGNARPRPMIAGSGPSSPVAFARLNPDGSWSRTYRDFSAQETLPGLPSETFSETWPRSGSMRGGRVYAHPMSALPTDGNASSSLLRTLALSGYEDGRGAGGELRAGILYGPSRRLLPTPDAGDAVQGPDYARANRLKSGGDDLTTKVARLRGDLTQPPSPDGSE